ncbi:MAG: helix-turn-helix domain-containing protein [Coxiellaceae bacterium]|nr:helix-turn-helix domain-containing protein [Coxiellaceae bacterium]
MTNKDLTKVLKKTMKGLHDIGLADNATMHEFDALSLPPIKKFTPNQIKRLRKQNKASQAVFAIFLNTTTSTVQKWEQGQKKPSRLALKLLNLVDRHGLDLLAA